MNKKIILIIVIIILMSSVCGTVLFFSLSDNSNENNDDTSNNQSIVGTWIGNLSVKDQVYYDEIITAEIKKFTFFETTVTYETIMNETMEIDTGKVIYEIYMNDVKEVVTGNYHISTDDSMVEELKGLYGGMLFFDYHEYGFVYFLVLNQYMLSINNAIFTKQ